MRVWHAIMEFKGRPAHMPGRSRAGSPGGARAAGGAAGRNPVPVICPCHRVVRADGGLGGYTGGLDIKTGLLRIEGVGQWSGLR